MGKDPKAHRDELERLKAFTLSRSDAKIKGYLENLPTTAKGPVFEEYLRLLYRWNGWIVKVQGGRGDVGADLLLYHPKEPNKVAFVVQAKNWSAPLTYDDAVIELHKFEEKGRKEYDCSFYQLVALNGYVKEARKLSRFNMILYGWDHVKDLIGSYDPDGIPEPRIDLYPHNQRSYEKVKRLFRKENRVCVIQATGTGKSYLIGKLVADNSEKRSIILAPSHYILKQIERDFHYVLSNNVRMTYAKLARLRADEFKGQRYDMIILDEYHRPGAKEWGRGVAALLDANPTSKVFGTTATPIRYLDDGRDMSEELFAGNVANEIGLPTAIARRILKAPVYISALYTLDEEIERLKDKIVESKRADDEKESLLDEVKAMQIDWEKAKGIPKILRKHLKAGTNKIIVFCRDRYHLDYMELEVQKWFLKAFRDRKRETYRVLSSENERDKELKRFKDAKDTNMIHLLFCINMLNEGLHIPDVGAVILLRPTESMRVFYQQIDRCIQIDSGRIPIIFDLVNNFKSICACGFAADLENAIENENVVREELGLEATLLDVEIHDETKNLVRLFDGIEKNIQLWKINYEQLIEFRKVYPDRWPSQKEEFSEGYMIGSWVSVQRRNYRKGILSRERISLLERIGFIWDHNMDAWQRQFSYLVEFRGLYPERWPKQREDYPEENHLGLWCYAQCRAYREGRLSIRRMRLLNTIGFIWDSKDEFWNRRFHYLEDFRKENPYRWPKNTEEYPEGIKIGNWCRSQRSQYKAGKLSPERCGLLESIGFIWSLFEDTWQKQLEYLKTFRKAHPERWPKSNEEYPKGNKLGNWCQNQRTYYGADRLLQEKIDLLESIGFIWSLFEDTWQKQFEYIDSFRKKHPDRWPKDTEEYPEGNKIGKWISVQRRNYRKGKISRERIRLLERIGFIWDHNVDAWQRQFSYLVEFRGLYPERWPASYEEFPEGNNLGKWCHRQRGGNQKGRLSKERVNLLKSIGFL